jgi:hypothetical protein
MHMLRLMFQTLFRATMLRSKRFLRAFGSYPTIPTTRTTAVDTGASQSSAICDPSGEGRCPGRAQLYIVDFNAVDCSVCRRPAVPDTGRPRSVARWSATDSHGSRDGFTVRPGVLVLGGLSRRTEHMFSRVKGVTTEHPCADVVARVSRWWNGKRVVLLGGPPRAGPSRRARAARTDRANGGPPGPEEEARKIVERLMRTGERGARSRWTSWPRRHQSGGTSPGAQSGSTASKITINAVASGPRRIDSSHQVIPLRPFDWAKPALMNASVPHPTA